MAARWDIAVVHTVEVSVEERHWGCWKVDCMCSVLQTAAKVVGHTEAGHILAKRADGVMQMVLEEEARRIDSEPLLLNCRKDETDKVAAAMTSAEPGKVSITVGFGQTCASRRGR
jgi:hypothetical protein